MNKLAAIEKVVRGNIELFSADSPIEDWEVGVFDKACELSYIGTKIFCLMTEPEERAKALSNAAASDYFELETRHVESDEIKWQILMAFVAIEMHEDINQCVYDTLNDEATRKGL